MDYTQSAKQELLEDYVLHRLNYMFAVYPEFSDFDTSDQNPYNWINAKQTIKNAYTIK